MPTRTARVCHLKSEGKARGKRAHAVGPDPSARSVRVKEAPVASRCLARLLTVVDKDPLESSRAGLFTSDNANTAEACRLANLCHLGASGKKKNMEVPPHTDSQAVLQDVDSTTRPTWRQDLR